MCGQLVPECCCRVVGGTVCGVVVEGVVVEGVVPPLTAANVTPAPIVSAAMTTSRTTSFVRTMAASFRSSPSKHRDLREGSETPVSLHASARPPAAPRRVLTQSGDKAAPARWDDSACRAHAARLSSLAPHAVETTDPKASLASTALSSKGRTGQSAPHTDRPAPLVANGRTRCGHATCASNE
jgi:hypothetical protein